MKGIVYICDARNCNNEEMVAPKSATPKGWLEGHVVVSTGLTGEKPRYIVLCPAHAAAMLTDLEVDASQ